MTSNISFDKDEYDQFIKYIGIYPTLTGKYYNINKNEFITVELIVPNIHDFSPKFISMIENLNHYAHITIKSNAPLQNSDIKILSSSIKSKLLTVNIKGIKYIIPTIHSMNVNVILHKIFYI